MKKYALIIGNDQYTDPKLPQLKTPTEDVRELITIFENKNIGGFDEVKSVINKNEPDARRAISRFLLADNKKPDDLVLIYFSGHGVLDGHGRLHLALADTETQLLSATALPSSFITDQMSQCRSKRQILILDCCYSGAFAHGTKSGEQKAITKSTFEGNGYGHVVLTASGSTQFALEGDQVLNDTEYSLFTHYLIEGLKTGEADRNKDGYISLDEWYDYAYLKVIEKTPNQIPQKWTYQQQGDLQIAKNLFWDRTPTNIPDELLILINSPVSNSRRLAVERLSDLAQSQDADVAGLAKSYLEKLINDSDFEVSSFAKNIVSLLRKIYSNKSLKPGENIIDSDALAELFGSGVQKKSPFETEDRITLSNGMEFVRISAGQFLMGTSLQYIDGLIKRSGGNRDAYQYETPQHQVNIHYDYWMARFPITNEQYKIYTNAKKTIHPVPAWEKKIQHPVVLVDWMNAINYCQWLNSLLREEIPQELVLRLPTEAEWEKASRGTDGRIYPWGNEFDKNKCNSGESKYDSTTPVGQYSPLGDTPYGCADMAGNVWEWTHSLYQQYPYVVDDGRENEASFGVRGLKGGSFLGIGEDRLARCSSRSSLGNSDKNPYVGFRICLAPSLPQLTIIVGDVQMSHL